MIVRLGKWLRSIEVENGDGGLRGMVTIAISAERID